MGSSRQEVPSKCTSLQCEKFNCLTSESEGTACCLINTDPFTTNLHQFCTSRLTASTVPHVHVLPTHTTKRLEKTPSTGGETAISPKFNVPPRRRPVCGTQEQRA